MRHLLASGLQGSFNEDLGLFAAASRAVRGCDMAESLVRKKPFAASCSI